MLQFGAFWGSGALTYLIERKLTAKGDENSFLALVRLVAYASLNTLVTVLCLHPLHKVEIVVMANGLKTFQYGGSAFVISFFVSAVMGVAIAALSKIGIHLEVDKRRKGDKA